jgi:hypothetical protein
MYGKKIRLVTTQNTYLSISGFEAYTGSEQTATTTTSTSSGTYNVKPNTKAGFNNGSARQSTNYGNN